MGKHKKKPWNRDRKKDFLDPPKTGWVPVEAYECKPVFPGIEMPFLYEEVKAAADKLVGFGNTQEERNKMSQEVKGKIVGAMKKLGIFSPAKSSFVLPPHLQQQLIDFENALIGEASREEAMFKAEWLEGKIDFDTDEEREAVALVENILKEGKDD